jgi:hypothetical protein
MTFESVVLMIIIISLSIAAIFAASVLACFTGIAWTRLLCSLEDKIGLQWLLATVGV